MSQISLLHDLAHKVEHNKDILPLFQAQKKDINSLRIQFLFLKLSTALRLQKIQTLRMCINCPSSMHNVSIWASKYSCRQCKAWHHSLLNLDQQNTSPEGAPVSASKSPSTSHTPMGDSASALVGLDYSSNSNVLGSALIRIRDKAGHWVPVRALLDNHARICNPSRPYQASNQLQWHGAVPEPYSADKRLRHV